MTIQRPCHTSDLNIYSDTGLGSAKPPKPYLAMFMLRSGDYWSELLTSVPWGEPFSVAIRVVGKFAADQHGVEEVAAIGNLDSQRIGLGCGWVHRRLGI